MQVKVRSGIVLVMLVAAIVLLTAGSAGCAAGDSTTSCRE